MGITQALFQYLLYHYGLFHLRSRGGGMKTIADHPTHNFIFFRRSPYIFIFCGPPPIH